MQHVHVHIIITAFQRVHVHIIITAFQRVYVHIIITAFQRIHVHIIITTFQLFRHVSPLFQEKKRLFPVLTSSQYGRRLEQPIEQFSRQHVQIEKVRKGFYYKRGTGLPPLPRLSTDE